MIRTALIGGTGYGAMELLRLSVAHPELEIVTLTSRSDTGLVADAMPHLRGFTDARFRAAEPRELAADHDLLVFATPHGVAAAQAHEVLDAHTDVRVLDLSGDHRLRDASLYPEHYGMQHPQPQRLADAVYGLPECGGRERVPGARLVANPGCHATAALLATAPLVEAGLVRGRIALTSTTGSTGSGRKPGAGTHHPERAANFKAYKPLQHQHLPEIEQCLAALGEAPVIDFVPQSAPIARGIAVTAFVPVPEASEADAASVIRARYEGERFVRCVPGTPELRAVVGSNMADVGTASGRGLLCVFVTLDNLLKGMAGTAVQNVNLLFGLPETTGLETPGLGP